MTIYCDKCIHSGLCKYEEAYRKKSEELKSYFGLKEGTFPANQSTYFSVELTCSKFDLVNPVPLPDITPLLNPQIQPTSPPYQPYPYDINSPVYQPIITCSTKEKGNE